MLCRSTPAAPPLLLTFSHDALRFSLEYTFIHQTKPLASFHPFLQSRQHPFRPYRRFCPSPSFPNLDFSTLLRAFSHFRWSFFPLYSLHTSTFLPPFAPHPLRCFFATMEALTPDTVTPSIRYP